MNRETFERLDEEKITDNNGILWWNEKHIEEELYYKNMQWITMKNHLEYIKHSYEPVDEPKKAIQHNFCRQKVSK